VACTNLFATHFARGEHRDAFAVLSDALYVSLACAALLVVGLSWGGGAALARICAMAPGALPGAKQYLAIRILGVPALMTATVLQGACTGMKDATSTPCCAHLFPTCAARAGVAPLATPPDSRRRVLRAIDCRQIAAPC